MSERLLGPVRRTVACTTNPVVRLRGMVVPGLVALGIVALGPAAPAPFGPLGSLAAQTRPLVVIDAGHGGEEPGAIGLGGVRETDIAMAIARAMAADLASDPWIEVRLIREWDVGIPVWERGERATLWKGDRTGIFISIHANALPDRPSASGFETFFLSPARDEHEQRVAAIENAGARTPDLPGRAVADTDPLLGAILSDLRTFDHQHWSADLAEEVQLQLARIHPGPDRGVKQGPFAVLTNSLMPSVLVEVGFITNPTEERLLALPEFQRDAGRALAQAARAFLRRYPPGQPG